MGILERLKSLLMGNKLDVDARYELLREAISGTMSNFYMARDRMTGQVVGLKICDAFKLEQFESRFKGLKKPTEGEIAVRLQHPRIVQTFEHGVTTKGLHYLVMEYLPGPGLHTLIHNRDPRLDGRRADLIRQMTEALDYLHRADYIHRDVCPRNFICSPEVDSLKLIDFGLTLPASKEFMQPGNRTGTPSYMAPEIRRRRPTDQRVDIYALGVTAYQLCTGQFPWQSPDDPTKVAIAAMTHDTVPPRDILSYAPELNSQLAQVIMQCLDANPGQRPQTAAELLRLLRPVKHELQPF